MRLFFYNIINSCILIRLLHFVDPAQYLLLLEVPRNLISNWLKMSNDAISLLY